VAKTTGPVLAIGGITLANELLLENKPMDWRVPIATGVAAGLFYLLEKAWSAGAVMLAYTALVSVMLVRLPGAKRAPIENLNAWLQKGKIG
jgi:membrane protein implicated in regulation of membrane protease activity